MVSTSTLQPPSETVLTFLESIGLRAEGEFYVRLFRQLPKESFAIILLDATVAERALGAVVEQLRFLAHLGLFAPVVFGGTNSSDAARPQAELRELLEHAGLGGRTFRAEEPGLELHLRGELLADRMPIVTLGEHTSPIDRVRRLAMLANALAARKLVLLRERGGIGLQADPDAVLAKADGLLARSGGFSVINLTTDRAMLETTGFLSEEDRAALGWIADFSAATLGRIPVNVASPLNLLRELFTVKGAGTLVRAGSDVHCSAAYSELDVKRLAAIIESSFGRRLRAGFFDTAPLAVYIESNYRAAAILHPGGPAPVLSKFAVDRVAQGEGLGQDLWQRLLRDHSSLVWRARPDNPITSWYQTVCEGMQRAPEWYVYWRGIPVAAVPSAVAWMESRVRDFEP